MTGCEYTWKLTGYKRVRYPDVLFGSTRKNALTLKMMLPAPSNSVLLNCNKKLVMRYIDFAEKDK